MRRRARVRARRAVARGRGQRGTHQRRARQQAGSLDDSAHVSHTTLREAGSCAVAHRTACEPRRILAGAPARRRSVPRRRASGVRARSTRISPRLAFVRRRRERRRQTAARAVELEDLEHVDQVDARGRHEQPERDDEHRPAEVQVAVVVGVVDEAQRDRVAGEHQRPAVEEQHRAPHAEADPRHAVVEVLLVGRVDRPAVLQPLEHDERRVEERHREQDQRQRERDDRRGLEVALDGDAAHQQAEQVRAGVAHEARRRREVVDEEAERRAGGERGEHAAGVLRWPARLKAITAKAIADDRADAGREPVDAVGEVDDVHHPDEPDRGERRPGVAGS